MHPRRLRCSSLKYSRYSRSSRLAGGAPRPSRCDARLSPRAVRLAELMRDGLDEVFVFRGIESRSQLLGGTEESGAVHRDRQLLIARILEIPSVNAGECG